MGANTYFKNSAVEHLTPNFSDQTSWNFLNFNVLYELCGRKLWIEANFQLQEEKKNSSEKRDYQEFFNQNQSWKWSLQESSLEFPQE